MIRFEAKIKSGSKRGDFGELHGLKCLRRIYDMLLDSICRLSYRSKWQRVGSHLYMDGSMSHSFE